MEIKMCDYSATSQWRNTSENWPYLREVRIQKLKIASAYRIDKVRQIATITDDDYQWYSYRCYMN